MTWKWVPAFLFTICVVICVWMYLRDRATPVVLQPGVNVAQADGDRLFNVLASRPACGRREFNHAGAHGFHGVRSATCPAEGIRPKYRI
jgi:hypothetical protein